jgi:gamma-glutamylcysteine synthetase
MKDLVVELLNIGASGLVRQHALNERGEDESIYLLRLTDLVRSGHSPASLTIDNWKGRWNYDIRRMVEGSSYEAEALF